MALIDDDEADGEAERDAADEAVRAAGAMRAAYIESTGPADRIRVGELPVPRPGPTDVLVRMEASAVNHVDLFVRSGVYPTLTPFPFVIGRDLVGTVVGAGSGAGAFTAGDRVWCNSLGYGGRQGAFAEYAVVSADRLYPLPGGVDPLAAAPVLHTGATAYLGLVREAALGPGETVFVAGAAGGVGSAVVQLATAMGARVVATCSPRDAAWCADCGADLVLDYHRDDLYARVREAAPGGIDVWWDNSGQNDFAGFLPLMATGGRAVVLSGLGAGSAPTLPVGTMYTKDVSVRGFAISNATVSDLAGAADVVGGRLAAGRLRARVGATFGLDEAAAAHRAMESGSVGGRRIVVVP